jgi:hypothetical protein
MASYFSSNNNRSFSVNYESPLETLPKHPLRSALCACEVPGFFTSTLCELRCEHMCTKILLCTVHLYEQNNVFLDCPEDGDSMLPGKLPLYQPTQRNIPVIWNRNDTPVLAL